ncbi:MAG: PDZ domain-containing protein [Acidobacteriota bacterium]
MSRLALLLTTLGLLLLTIVAPPLAVAQTLPQIEEEDLDESQTPIAEVTDPGIDLGQVQQLFDEAEAVFQSADQPASLPLFGRVVDLLESLRLTRGLDPAARDLLVRSLSYRGQVQFNLGMTELVDASLRQMLEVNSDADLDRDLVSPKLATQFDRLRKSLVGEITFILDPPDAEVRVDGEVVDALSGPVGVLTGLRTLLVSRPGHGSIERQLEVTGGSGVSLDLVLPRESAVLRLNTRPQETEVRVDGQVVGSTGGVAPEGFLPEGAAAVYRRDEFSDELVVEGVDPGLKVLEVVREGYRTYRAELQIVDLLDYQMPPIVLEPESGKIQLDDFPPGAEILIDGEPRVPDVAGTTRPQVTLPPGEYHLTVTSGAARMFSTHLRVADRQTVPVRVRLRPGLTFLGVLGADRSSARTVDQTLRRTMAESSKWTLVNRAEEGPRLLAPLGLDAAGMRALEASSPSAPQIDWRAVQAEADRRAPGLVYVLAVLDNDLVASEATLWIWPAAPGPPRPEKVRVPVGDPASYAEVRGMFERTVPLRRPFIGALVIDSDAVPHPVVADVAPASPAAEAGLAVGDQILGIAGITVTTRSELEARIVASESGESIQLAVQAAGGPARTVDLRLGASPWVMSQRDPGLLDAVAYPELVLLEEKTPREQRWLVQLDRALVLLRAGEHEAAVRSLRDIRAPQRSHGVNQATVDYWLGLALWRVGPEFRDAARQALERAAQVPGARLDHDDEAWVAPRAAARLEALAGGG